MVTKTDTITPDLLAVEPAAKRLGYNPEYLRELIRQGKIHAKRFGKSLAIAASEIERYQREQMQ